LLSIASRAILYTVDMVRRHRSLVFSIAAAASLLLAGPGLAADPAGCTTTTVRPGTWAAPVGLPGVPNLFRVAPGLYRSAQPSGEGMRSLREYGIETVVNLRSFHSDRDEIGVTGLAYEHLYVKAWHPERKEAVRFLQIVTDPEQAPVLVHCQHGADRTGALCAVYRMAVQGWTKEAAIREMVEGGFGFHRVWGNLIAWVEKLDIESIKAEAGLEPPGTGATCR
jgi:protein tyrosine phosphatase (PTP) superfamily phosphohydrolase (DUF442 family)